MDMGFVGWIVIGFLAGTISGWVVRRGSPQGCIATIVVGILGGLIGGWLSRQLGFGDVQGFLAALLFATLGAILVRVVLSAINRDDRR